VRLEPKRGMLDRQVKAAHAGESCALVLCGEPGPGKTALAFAGLPFVRGCTAEEDFDFMLAEHGIRSTAI
jgi:hypothetical protein